MNYWEKRALKDSLRSINLTEKFINIKLRTYYNQASKDVQKDIEKLYLSFANKENITLSQAKQKINATSFKNIDYEALVKSAIDKKDDYLLSYIKALSKKGQITRLQLVDLEIQKTLSKLFNEERISIYEHLEDTYQDSYFRNIYNMQTYFQMGISFIKPNENLIKKAITARWSKINYSKRIWKHRQQLSEELRRHINVGLIQGSSINDMSRKIAKDMNVSLNNAIRLVRTETNYIHNQATLDEYLEYAKIEEYKYLATLDFRTSKLCQELDGCVFKTSEVKVGINYPPMHPNCRSTTVAYFKDDKVGERIARGSDGKTYYVPADITYKEWFNNLSENKKGKIYFSKDIPNNIEKPQELKYDVDKKKPKGLGVDENIYNAIPKHDEPKLLEKLNIINDNIISTKLKEYENIIVKDNQKENAIVITKEGEVWQCFGIADRVFPDVDLGDKLYGAYVTHNHPMNETNYSFSDADLNLFLNYELKILRGCDYKYEYSFERTLNTIKEDAENISHKFRTDYYHEILEQALYGKIEIGEYNEYHYINEIFSKYNNFNYERIEH